MSDPVLEASPSEPPSPWSKSLATAGRLGVDVKVVLGLASVLALILVNVSVSRYLAAFGQPGLLTWTDVAPFLTGFLPLLVWVALVIACFACLPALSRWIALSEVEHRFSDAFGWMVAEGAPRLRRLAVYVWLHAAALVLAVMLIIGFFELPVRGFGGWMAGGLAISPLVIAMLPRGPLVLSWRTARRACHVLALYILSNVFLAAWLVLPTWLALSPIRDLVRGGPWFAGPSLAAGVLVALVFLHLIISAAHWRATILLMGMIAIVALLLTGDRALTNIALRFAGLGGGSPLIYRTQGTGGERRLVTACLVLATANTRIVWSPPARKANQSPPPCTPAAFQAHLTKAAKIADAGGVADPDQIRVLKRDDLFDKP